MINWLGLSMKFLPSTYSMSGVSGRLATSFCLGVVFVDGEIAIVWFRGDLDSELVRPCYHMC